MPKTPLTDEKAIVSFRLSFRITDWLKGAAAARGWSMNEYVARALDVIDLRGHLSQRSGLVAFRRCDDLLDVPVLADERRGGLLADPPNARKTVRWIAAQDGEIRVRAPGDAVFGLDVLLIDALQFRHAAHREEHVDVGIQDKLE